MLGGELQLLVAGGAPLTPSTQEFMELVFCTRVIQGYGMTETAAAGTCQWAWRPRSHGVVGAPAPCCEIRLEPVPEMGYILEKGQGEICFRGANVMQGYFKRPDLNAECFSPDGFLRSGDIGQWDENGELQILDRKKNLIKLAAGEYVATEAIEMRCQPSSFAVASGYGPRACAHAVHALFLQCT